MVTKGIVKGIVSNLVTVEVDGPVSQNEICYISVGDVKLMSEVIKVIGKNAFIQVFESTRGMRVGDEAEFQGYMLKVTLGLGMSSRNYNGLRDDLNGMEGVFLKRGNYAFALGSDKKWGFKPLAKAGDTMSAGDWLGEVDENFQPHKIMVPFRFGGSYTVKSVIPAGQCTISDTMAVLTDENSTDANMTMIQKWLVKRAITCYKERPRPFKLLETGVRTIDTVNPIVEGGTGFIPDPFGTGEAVLQHAISRQVEADIVIIAACGERANKVVEVLAEFPGLVDSHTGRKLMERTTIVANTSSVPVAARETSVYTTMTIAGYYRSMGLKILLVADSTSRWTQALRKVFNRLEELPGPDALPIDLSVTVASFYARAGPVHLNSNAAGSITFIDTVSPAGGNLKKPVTENTRRVARYFYVLGQERTDRKRYPAVNPIESYSKYIEYSELQKYIAKHISPEWIEKVSEIKAHMLYDKEISEQINILGDDGVPVEYHITFWKSRLIDFMILQQDAFNAIDAVTPLQRQEFMLNRIVNARHSEFRFDNFLEVMDYFKRMINIFKQIDYSEYESDQFRKFNTELDELLEERIEN